MTGTRLNQIVAAGIAFVNSIFPLLVLTGAVDWTPDTLAAVYLVVSNFFTLLGLILAQSPATNTDG